MYPTPEQVETADHYQICSWWRFLPSPGSNYIDKENFHDMLEKEVKIMNRIGERLKDFGGFTPEISKALGW